MYTYYAEFKKAVDGDTVDLKIDLGFYMYAHIRVRLLEVDTPERGQPNFKEATQFVKDWFGARGNCCIVTTEKAGKYGRWLAEIFSPPEYVDKHADIISLNQQLLDAGLAKPYK